MIAEPFSLSRNVVATAVEKFLQSLIQAVQRVFGGRLGNLRVAVGAVIVSLFVNFPAYHSFNYILHNDLIIQAISAKIQHPLTPIPSNLTSLPLTQGVGSHINKLELRLTVPILGRLSGTGIWTVVIWSHLSGFGVFYLLALLANKALNDEVGAALFVLGISSTFLGGYFFNDLDNGDGVAFFFLLLSIATGNVLVSSVCFLAAAFCDERAAAAIPLLLLYLAFRHSGDQEKSLRRNLSIAILVGAGVWGLLRSWISIHFHLTMGTSDLATRAIFRQHMFSTLPDVFLKVFKASWVLPLFAVSSLALLRKWGLFVAFAGAFAVAIAPAFMVWDFDRSACYAFVALLISLYFLRGDKAASRRYLAAILIVNLLLISPGATIFRIPFKAIFGFSTR